MTKVSFGVAVSGSGEGITQILLLLFLNTEVSTIRSSDMENVFHRLEKTMIVEQLNNIKNTLTEDLKQRPNDRENYWIKRLKPLKPFDLYQQLNLLFLWHKVRLTWDSNTRPSAKWAREFNSDMVKHVLRVPSHELKT